jgi:hypothetical protein
MTVGIQQFRILPQHIAFLEHQRVRTAPASTPEAARPQPAAEVYSGAELARTALMMVQCQTVQDIERDTHTLTPGLYEQPYGGPWARVGE